MSSLRGIEKRGKQLRKRRGMSTGGGGSQSFENFQKYRAINLRENESGYYMFLGREEDGILEPLMTPVLVHRSAKVYSSQRCTADLEGYDGRCVYCHYQDMHRDDEDDPYGVTTRMVMVARVWDFNYYVLETNKKNPKYKNWTIWTPPKRNRKSAEPPADAQLGGLRFMELSTKRWESLRKFEVEANGVCRCVTSTGDWELSNCYPVSAICPECGMEVFNEEEMLAIGHNLDIDREVFSDQLHPCLWENEGGCWNEEKDAELEGYSLLPVYECGTHIDQPEKCDGAEPLDFLNRPVRIERTGQGFNTLWDFSVPEGSFWRNLDQYKHNDIWANWADYEVPSNIQSIANGLTQTDVLNSITPQSLERQAKWLKAEMPYEEDYNPYEKKEKKGSDNKNKRRQHRRR